MVYVDVPAHRLRPGLLREALRGSADDVSSSTALSLLANPDVDVPDRAELLQDAVSAPEVADTVRASSLRTLAHFDAGQALAGVRDLDASGEHLAVAAATTVGQLGEPEDVAALDRLRQTYAASDLLRRRVEFAGALLAHRFGLTERAGDIPAVDLLPVPGAAATAFVSAPSGALRTSAVLAALQRELPWMVAGEHFLVDVACGGRVLGVVARQDLRDLAVRRRLFERPAVAAAVATESVEHGGVSLALLVLTRPAEEGRLAVIVTRPTGEPVYAGSATSSPDGTVTAELSGVRRPGGVACTIRALLSDAGPEIFGRTGAAAVVPPRMPERRPEADPPDPRDGG
jgi:hypothetical protein